MRIPILWFFLSLFAVQCFAQDIKPTPVRTWKSNSGKAIEAVATKLTGDQVTLVNRQRKQLTIPITAFVEEDQTFLRKHFAPPPPPPPAHPLGESSGPIDASGGTYFVYLPDSFDTSRQSPLLVYTGAGGGKSKTFSQYKEGLDRLGWAFIAVVESKNGQPYSKNLAHSKACMEHALKALSVDPKRVYFTGNSGGGAQSLHNLSILKGAGAIPMIAYIPRETELDERRQHVFAIGGVTDYNRYLSAHAVKRFGDHGMHRFHSGGHAGGPNVLREDAIIWLEAQSLMDAGPQAKTARHAFEKTMATCITEFEASEPHRAYYWALFLIQEFKASGPDAQSIRDSGRRLGATASNVDYAEAITKLHEFSVETYAPFGAGGGSSMGHTTEEIKTAAKALAERYKDTPSVGEIVGKLGDPTITPGKKKK